MSATIGTFAARTISFSAAVASAVGQDTRMMSAPASSQRRIWSMVDLASSVGVLVMVWTLIGASPPTGTEPIMICRDLRRSISRNGRMDMRGHIGPEASSGKARSYLSFCVNTVNRDALGGPYGQACPNIDNWPCRGGGNGRATRPAAAHPLLRLPELQP